MAMCMRIETVETSTFTMDYFKFGHGARTLAIIPGLSVQSVMKSADVVAASYRLLTDDFTIYVFDPRNELPTTYSIREMARDTAEALRALGLRRASVLGVSLGGMVAMTMAIEHPELVGELVLCCTTARETDTLRQTGDHWLQLAKAGNAETLYLAFGEAIYPENVFEQSRGPLVELAKSVTDGELARFVVLAEGVKGFDVEGGLGKISCPVLLVGSKDDRVLGADATERIAARLDKLPGFALHLYDGYGHAAYDTAPDFKQRILRFLSSTGSPGTDRDDRIANAEPSGAGASACRAWYDGDPVLEEYHDREWCQVNHGDRFQFEMLCLEGASVGLSWKTIMHKREAYKAAFHGFDIDACAAMSDDELEALMDDAGIIRNRAKIFSVRRNAQVVKAIQEEFGSFDAYLWGFVDGKRIDGRWKTTADMPTASDVSRKMSADMKKRGIGFVGPVITYSFMQSIGIVNDHLADCPCR